MLLANANLPTVAVCLETWSCVTQLYRSPDDFMNTDAAVMVISAVVNDRKSQAPPPLNG